MDSKVHKEENLNKLYEVIDHLASVSRRWDKMTSSDIVVCLGVQSHRLNSLTEKVEKELKEERKELNKNYNDWNRVISSKPREGEVVETKIDDDKGLRNECELIYEHGLWFFPDRSMHTYYTPTHWRYK